MITALIITLATFILGICGFLFKHTLKSIFVDPSSDPRLLFEDDKTKMAIHVSHTTSLENSLAERVNAEMDGKRKIYAPKTLDPYMNPLLALQEYSFPAKMLNQCKQIYLDSLEEFIRRKLYSDIVRQRWKPIDIYIVNNGSIATKPMRVVIKGSNNSLYGNTKIKENTGICYYPPTGKEQFYKDIYVRPDFYLKKIDYQYLTVTDGDLIQEAMTLEIKDPVRQGKDNRVKLATFYIDTNIATEIIIEWNIYEDTLGKYGNHGVLKIECMP